MHQDSESANVTRTAREKTEVDRPAKACLLSATPTRVRTSRSCVQCLPISCKEGDARASAECRQSSVGEPGTIYKHLNRLCADRYSSLIRMFRNSTRPPWPRKPMCP